MSNKKLRIGLLGVGRGHIICDYCNKVGKKVELVAICDKWKEGLGKIKDELQDDSIAYYTDFDEFLKHNMDMVFLANYATQHAPFAIKAMRAGKDVASEVLPVQNMAEAVALIEAVEETGRKYCYAENYCYMLGPIEMKRQMQSGDLGEFEYGEGEYMHNCEDIWYEITRADPNHWRNTMSAFFYCTHSVGPLLHISGQRPVKVVGMEGPFTSRMARMGAKAGAYAVELATLQNGAVIKSLHGVAPSKNSVWYSVYGAEGRIETAREDATFKDAECQGTKTVYVNRAVSNTADGEDVSFYTPKIELDADIFSFGHAGSDVICLHNIFEYMLGNKSADVVDVYEAIDMWMVGFFGYLSVLEGGSAQYIPDLRSKEIRNKYRNDRRCTDTSVAGEQLLPSYSKGTPDIAPEIYAEVKRRGEEMQKAKEESQDNLKEREEQ